MKHIVVSLGVIVLVAGAAGAQTIVGSAHDFSGNTWSQGQICLPCHTPHNAVAPADVPLWNHETTTQSFTVYTSPTLNATDVGQPEGASIACLSCHDGTVALENFGGVTNGTTYITGDANLGTDLSNDHPVSFTYNTALATADGELYDPATALSGLGGTIAADMLFADKMQCASCHDVHNTVSAGNPSLLLITSEASALCLTCHSK